MRRAIAIYEPCAWRLQAQRNRAAAAEELVSRRAGTTAGAHNAFLNSWPLARLFLQPCSRSLLAEALRPLLSCSLADARVPSAADARTGQSNAAVPLRPPPRPTRKHQRPQNRQATSLLGSADPSRRPSRKASPRRMHGSSFGAGPRKRDPGPPPKSPRDTQVPRRALALGDHFFSKDGTLRRDPSQVSHFELLGLPKGLDVDDDALDEGLRVLQRRLHPLPRRFSPAWWGHSYPHALPPLPSSA